MTIYQPNDDTPGTDASEAEPAEFLDADLHETEHDDTSADGTADATPDARPPSDAH